MKKIKNERLASNIARELSVILHHEAKDQLFKNVTITDVDVSNDYSVAKVYYTFLGDYDKQYVNDELNKASKYLRTELASKIDVRHTPELRFKFDESIAYGTNIERILEEIKK